MISFDLRCSAGHTFEGWFRSNAEFETQAQARQIPCAVCGDLRIEKAVMAPNVGRKGNQLAYIQPPAPTLAQDGSGGGQPMPTTPVMAGAPSLPPEMVAMMAAIAQAQAESLPKSRYVGADFARQARAMHGGEQEPMLIHGQTTTTEAEALIEEGVSIMPLLVPVVPPEQRH